MTNQQKTENAKPVGTPRLWAGWFTAIGAWGLHLFLSYSFVEWYCRNMEVISGLNAKVILHSLTALCFLLALFGGWLALSSLLQLQNRKQGLDNTLFSRSRFMAVSGILLSLFLAVIILVQGLPNLVLLPCH